MRGWLLAAGIVLPLAGCARPEAPPIALASKPCAKVAESRVRDARANNYDTRAQKIVFRYTYADCVKWEAKGYEPGIP